jgi:hypothetical protein
MLGRRHTPKPEALALTLPEVPQRPNLTNQELETLRNAFFWLIETFSAGLYVGGASGVEPTTVVNLGDGPPDVKDCIWDRYNKTLHLAVHNQLANVLPALNKDTPMQCLVTNATQLKKIHKDIQQCILSMSTTEKTQFMLCSDSDILKELMPKMNKIAKDGERGWSFNEADVLAAYMKYTTLL